MNEARYYEKGIYDWLSLVDSHDGKLRLVKKVENKMLDLSYSEPVCNAIKSWKLYQFHDTSSTASSRYPERIEDNLYLRHDAANIAPYLLRLKTEHTERYNEIINVIQLAMPYFNDFILNPYMPNEQISKVRLAWRQKGSDYPLQPYHLSDGSLRLICLATALLQPNPPKALIIDEPELGLHPDAIGTLAELIEAASIKMQVIIATQSPILIDHFSVKDIVVVNCKDGASTFERLAENDLKVWLEEYSLGELWRKNIISGGPMKTTQFTEVLAIVAGQTEKTFIHDILQPSLANKQVHIISYFSMFEFVALLFSDADILAKGIGLKISDSVKKILEEFNGNPEQINNSPHKTPLKRLVELLPITGISIAKEISISKIREKCKFFQ